jgi:two-component system chemotaxis response regulator CheY
MTMHGNLDTAQFKLPTVLDLAAADGFLDSMRRQRQASPTLRIDASSVDTLTLPCIQVILAALNDFESLSIERPSEAFVSAFADLGLDWSEGCRPEAIGVTMPAAAAPAPPAIAAPEPAATAVTGKRILTIDDSKTIRDMLRLTLVEAGYEVFQAVDGEDGMNVLSRQEVDIVITDINMPKMDGYEVVRQIRSNPAYEDMPVLVLTTESEAEKKNVARDAGATGWMVKPFDPERLIATVRKVAP